jgi:hypothetical protein
MGQSGGRGGEDGIPLCVPSSLPAACPRTCVPLSAMPPLAFKPETSRMSALPMRTIVPGA